MLSTNFLQPTLVSVRMTYIVQFQEPTITQNTPMPMYLAPRSYRKPYRKATVSKAVLGSAILAMLARRNYRPQYQRAIL